MGATNLVPIRRSLITSFVAVVLLLGGTILIVFVAGARRAVLLLSTSVIRETDMRITERIDGFFDDAREGLSIASSWGTAGLLDLDDTRSLDRIFFPLMREMTQYSSILVADGNGREYMLMRDGSTWRSRLTRPDEWGSRVQWRTWTKAGPEPQIEWREDDYDPRQRPWYAAAVKAAGTGEIGWTAPYRFHTTRELGITASTRFANKSGLTHVVGFDVLLSLISDTTSAQRVIRNGMIVVSSDDQVIGLPATPQFDTAEERRTALESRSTPAKLGIPVIARAAGLLGTPPEGTAASDPVRFRSGRQWWWGNINSHRPTPDRSWEVMIVVPESDLVGTLRLQWLWIIIITIIVLIGAMTRVVVMARRYSHPIERLVQESRRMSRGDLEPAERVVTGVAEMQELADAQDQMREGLASLMKLEQDLQVARRIQQSGFPKTLPVPEGFQIDGWSEPADETGGDTYDVVKASDTQSVLLLADATGHGIGPALSATQIRAMLRMAVGLGTSLHEISRRLNEHLCDDLPAGRFITAWLGVVDGPSRTLHSFSAGQAPLLHYVASEKIVRVLAADTLPFGIEKGIDVTCSQQIQLGKGDVFAVISDGIYEAMDPAGQLFGTKRVEQIIASHRNKAPEAISLALRQAVGEFTDNGPAGDDRTAIVLRCGR